MWVCKSNAIFHYQYVKHCCSFLLIEEFIYLLFGYFKNKKIFMLYF
jgi:hypothetical protein